MTKICPTHGLDMLFTPTKFGKRFYCKTEGCSMVCWDGPTSLPADFETRQCRLKAHAAFDELWQSGRVKRRDMYRRLSEFMDLPGKETHIGMFDAAQCEKVVRFTEYVVETSERSLIRGD